MTEDIILCRSCGILPVRYLEKSKRYSSYCSKSCPQIHNADSILSKYKSTCMERYGVENTALLQTSKDKVRSSCLMKYGTCTPMQNKEIKEKSRNTSIEKYGTRHPMQNAEVKAEYKRKFAEAHNGIDNASKLPEIIEKIKVKAQIRWNDETSKQDMLNKRIDTCRNMYGYDWHMQRPEFLDMVQDSSVKKYGTLWPMQNTEIAQKCQGSGYRLKAYVFPSGNIVMVQGYEPLAISKLLKSGYCENDLIIGRKFMPKFKYMFDGSIKMYTPDIFIPKDNLIIEVKSDFLYQVELEKNLAKQAVCIEQGYNFNFMIFNGKHQQV